MILPLTLIYLHQVLRIPLPVVGALLAASAVVGLLAVPVAGMAMDRIGARPILVVTLAGQALGEAGIAWAHSLPAALPALAVLGISSGPAFPAFQTLLAGVNPDPARQQRAFAVNFTGLNAGIGIGAAIGALVADVRHPGSFQALFVANGLSCLIFAAIVARLPNVRAEAEPGRPAAGYREILARPALRTVLIATLVLAFTGYAAADSGLPAFATVEGHVPVRFVELSITVNTIVVVAAQMFVLRLVRRLRRSRALALTGVIWAASWAIFGLSALPVSAGLRAASVLAFNGLFGLGETVLAPTLPPLLNSLSEDQFRGRANSLSSAAYSAAFVVSPAISTTMIAGGLAAVWIVLLCAGCLSAVLLGLRLASQLTGGQDRVEAIGIRVGEPAGL